MAKPLYGSKRYIQRDIQVFRSANLEKHINELRSNKFPSIKYWKIVERYIKKAMLIVVNRAKTNIQTMNAVATGFMRNSIVSVVNVRYGKTPILAKIGTKAWYDILVHEGLGRHSPSGKIPDKYRPTPEQLAIIPHSISKEFQKEYWKHSPKRPRPFLKMAIQQTKGAVRSMINKGLKEAQKQTGKKGSQTLVNVTKKVLNSAGGI